MGSGHLNSGGGYVPRDGLPLLKVGDQLDIGALNKIIQGINRASIVTGEGYQVRRYSNATVIQPKQYVSGGKFRNFQVYCYIDANGQGHCTVSIGTVNRCIPKINGRYLDNADSNGLQPKVSGVSSNGYIVIEANYADNKPFPSESNIKFVTELQTTQNSNTSQYPLASVKYKNASTSSSGAKEPAGLLTSQLHDERNLSVSRVKVGQSTFYWQWWIV
jgi:hypothetical protein